MRSSPYPDSESITAPLVIGTDPGGHSGTVAIAAAACVPPMKLFRKSLRGRKKSMQPFTRKVVWNRDVKGSFAELTCWDREDGGDFVHINWKLTVHMYAAESFSEIVTTDSPNLVFLDVSSYQLTEGGVVAAPQLALARHLFVAGYRAFDPNLKVVGGQHRWLTEWWPDVEPK